MAGVTMMNRGSSIGGGGGGGGGAMVIDDGSDSNSKRGVKRQTNDSDLDRFSKRLRALSIRNDERRAERNAQPKFHKRVPSKPGVLSTGFKRTTSPPSPHDGMDVDSTRDRVYIADLDAELATSSSSDDEEKLIFLPDIEKRFNRLPAQFFAQRAAEPPGQQELVLYSDPKSLSVADEGQDSVRKAVVEARHRAREKAAMESQARQEDMERSYSLPGAVGQFPQQQLGAGEGDVGVETAHGYGDVGYISPLRLDHGGDGDPDAMDLG